jgi:hypothetical protein
MTMVVHALKEQDLVARIHFCNWFLQSAHNGEVYPQLKFSYVEAWFSLHGQVNSEHSQWWSTENPGLIHKLPLHDKKNSCLVCNGRTL